MTRTNALIDDTQANFRNQGASICNLEHQVGKISKLLTERTQGALPNDERIIECVNNLDALPIYECPKSLKFKELRVFNVNNISSKKEPPKLELKQLSSHLRYAFLEESSFYPIIINSSLNDLEEEKLLRVLREHRKAIGWTIDDIKGISPSICMHKILMEETYKPLVQPQRRLNPSMQEVVKKEVVKLMDLEVSLDMPGFTGDLLKIFPKLLNLFVNCW
ncbi:hypothetical protein UlMin_026380 [Ulmus minor]